MGDAGSPYARFQRALATGNLHLIRAAAAELPRVDLGDALAVCMAIRHTEPERFERAALRWLARYAVEKATSVADVRLAADAFAAMVQRPEDALLALQRLV
jgi:ribosomal protein S7